MGKEILKPSTNNLIKIYQVLYKNATEVKLAVTFVLLIHYVIFRVTPLYAFVIFFCATMFEFVGFGPMWKTIISPEVQDCRANWWTNLLYISNYVNADHMVKYFIYLFTILIILILVHGTQLVFILRLPLLHLSPGTHYSDIQNEESRLSSFGYGVRSIHTHSIRHSICTPKARAALLLFGFY